MSSGNEDFLKKLKKSDELRITVKGRKTKKKLSTPVWFVLSGRKVRIVPVSGVETEWFKNLADDPQIGLSVGGVSVSSKAKLVSDPAETGRILGELKAKYVAMWSDSYYPRHDVYVEVSL